MQGVVAPMFPGLPDELRLAVLSYLNPKELGRCSRVCRDGARLAADDSLWSRQFTEYNKGIDVLRERHFSSPQDGIGNFFSSRQEGGLAICAFTSVERGELPEGCSAREFFKQMLVNSDDQLVSRTREFAKKAPLDVRSRFTCFFPINPACMLQIEIGPNSSEEQAPSYSEIAVFDREFTQVQPSTERGIPTGHPHQRGVLFGHPVTPGFSFSKNVMYYINGLMLMATELPKGTDAESIKTKIFTAITEVVGDHLDNFEHKTP